MKSSTGMKRDRVRMKYLFDPTAVNSIRMERKCENERKMRNCEGFHSSSWAQMELAFFQGSPIHWSQSLE